VVVDEEDRAVVWREGRTASVKELVAAKVVAMVWRPLATVVATAMATAGKWNLAQRVQVAVRVVVQAKMAGEVVAEEAKVVAARVVTVRAVVEEAAEKEAAARAVAARE